jgi:hypothetical protein
VGAIEVSSTVDGKSEVDEFLVVFVKFVVIVVPFGAVVKGATDEKKEVTFVELKFEGAVVRTVEVVDETLFEKFFGMKIGAVVEARTIVVVGAVELALVVV